MREVFDNMLMFWTGHQRDAGSVLEEQNRNVEAKLEFLGRMRDQARELYDRLNGGAVDTEGFGRVLHEGWLMKRELAGTITNSQIDHWYDAAMAAGAEGGKLCGAGGGGFLLFLVRPDRHAAVRAAMSDLLELHVDHEVHGSQLVIPFHHG